MCNRSGHCVLKQFLQRARPEGDYTVTHIDGDTKNWADWETVNTEVGVGREMGEQTYKRGGEGSVFLGEIRLYWTHSQAAQGGGGKVKER